MAELIEQLRAAAENELKGKNVAAEFLWLAAELERQEANKGESK